MEERKTAAIVLSILALVAIFFMVIMPYINLKRTHTLSYKTCSIAFNYVYNTDSLDDGYRTAQNKLALCLCHTYEKQKNVPIARQILKIYKQYGTSVSPDSIHYLKYANLDSILKYRKMAFDTLILFD